MAKYINADDLIEGLAKTVETFTMKGSREPSELLRAEYTIKAQVCEEIRRHINAMPKTNTMNKNN